MQSFEGSESKTAQNVLAHSENPASSQTWDTHMNWCNLSQNNNYYDSNVSESSVAVCQKIDERINLLSGTRYSNDFSSFVISIEKDFDNLAIDSQRISQEENNNETLSELKELTINPDGAKTSKVVLAGKLESVVGSLGIILVKPTAVNKLLDISTPLFVCLSDSRSESFINCTIIGRIDDILGSVKNPVYCVLLEPNVKHYLREEEKIYYMENHPDTSSICVKQETNGMFHLVHQRSASYLCDIAANKNKLPISEGTTNRKRGQVNKNYWRYCSNK